MAKLHHAHAGLLLIRNKRQIMIPLTKDVTTIGRKLADIILDDPKVSSTHTEIRRKGSKFHVVDLKSTNGTFLNQKQIEEEELVDQDVIDVGSSTICFFADSRDFRGQVEDTNTGTKPKVPPVKEVSVSQKVGDSLTTTKTMAQVVVTVEILQGPNSGKKYKFKKPHITIGRSDADLVLMDLDVSRNHCLIEVFGPQSVFLRDLSSTNGTIFNGDRIQSEKIQSGAEFSVGNSVLRIVYELGAN